MNVTFRPYASELLLITQFSKFVSRGRSLALGFIVLAAVAGCTTPPANQPVGEVFDPYETMNRRTHAFNKEFDSSFTRKAAGGYVETIPPDIRTSISNFSDNFSLPSVIVNNLLQADVKAAAANSYRFLVNSTLGFGGLFDVAADFGIGPDETDFGETLHVWGAPAGAYIELPILGPSNERDVAGKVVDLFTNPLSYVLEPPEKYYGTASKVADKLESRGRYSESVDSVMRDSADSYVQTRLIFVQNRRYELGVESPAISADPYADAATNLTSGQLLDPYEDPYAE